MMTADLPNDAEQVLRVAYAALALAFRRLEGSARSRDTELCEALLKVRADIETTLKAHGRIP